MRNAFAKELTELAKENDRIVLLSGDIGNHLFDEFKKKFSSRFFNCGVAEANMIGISSGMALSGLRPITYTIASFATVRCLEQIRNDLCYHRVPVIVVGVGGGLSYANLGATHHSCEDIAMIRSLPNMTIVCPGDPIEVRYALREALCYEGPVYIRLGKKGEPIIHEDKIDFSLGKALTLRYGKEVCLLSTGNLLPTAVHVAERLSLEGISTGVVSFHTVKPLDISALNGIFTRYRLVVGMEEHSLIGGFCSAISEYLVDHMPHNATKFLRLGTEDRFLCLAGSQNYAREVFSLSVDKIFSCVIKRYQNSHREISSLC